MLVVSKIVIKLTEITGKMVSIICTELNSLDEKTNVLNYLEV